MTDFIVMAIVLAIVGGAAFYIYKEKKKGVRCVGCSHAGECAKRAQGLSCDS
ncbi:MAG: FeoB-associated Cys-rich membrane protein [Oscillospiraceae bacterium]|nr:FeoB-associated Cys-rich membrane protein [Oscillospiraceae bacterium]